MAPLVLKPCIQRIRSRGGGWAPGGTAMARVVRWADARASGRSTAGVGRGEREERVGRAVVLFFDVGLSHKKNQFNRDPTTKLNAVSPSPTALPALATIVIPRPTALVSLLLPPHHPRFRRGRARCCRRLRPPRILQQRCRGSSPPFSHSHSPVSRSSHRGCGLGLQHPHPRRHVHRPRAAGDSRQRVSRGGGFGASCRSSRPQPLKLAGGRRVEQQLTRVCNRGRRRRLRRGQRSTQRHILQRFVGHCGGGRVGGGRVARGGGGGRWRRRDRGGRGGSFIGGGAPPVSIGVGGG